MGVELLNLPGEIGTVDGNVVPFADVPHHGGDACHGIVDVHRGTGRVALGERLRDALHDAPGTLEMCERSR